MSLAGLAACLASPGAFAQPDRGATTPGLDQTVSPASATPAPISDIIPVARPRLLVLTDISNEPDDEESLVRLLVYSNQFEIEGLVATTSAWLQDRTREDLIRRMVYAYGEVRTNLLKHADGFPSVEHLLAVTATGQAGFGMAAVGDGMTTAGSHRITEAVDREDERPLWITIWGGSNTLAQALRDVRASRSAAELARFVSKIRVYSISDQDNAGPWMRREFPGLVYIVSPSNPSSWEDYYLATWTGISGDRNYRNGPGHRFEMVDNPWLTDNVIRGHGPLGALYPPLKYIMEGDTPSYLGLIDNGLGSSISPDYGGWGGRYKLYQPAGETRPTWTHNSSARDTVTADNGRTETSSQATIWRWREHYQNDFAARMDWCVADRYDDANHNPRPVLNGDTTSAVLEFSAESGATVDLSAIGTTAGDDGQTVGVSWWIYNEAGSIWGAKLTRDDGLSTRVVLPRLDRPGTLHVILQATDNGTPPLVAYRRAIIRATP
ncbi:MAG: DUF1593 domain-containing protein [Phycisphaeraceae bacterium]|nr:MAG: DUF1593 domain-containing protein [Phycisphaeraceae bacterium]